MLQLQRFKQHRGVARHCQGGLCRLARRSLTCSGCNVKKDTGKLFLTNLLLGQMSVLPPQKTIALHCGSRSPTLWICVRECETQPLCILRSGHDSWLDDSTMKCRMETESSTCRLTIWLHSDAQGEPDTYRDLRKFWFR